MNFAPICSFGTSYTLQRKLLARRKMYTGNFYKFDIVFLMLIVFELLDFEIIPLVGFVQLVHFYRVKAFYPSA